MNDVDLIESIAIDEARLSFWAYRQFINPEMKKGWWQRSIAYELQEFWKAMLRGERPILVIQAPPQHGKSFQIIDFLTWVVGHNPSLKMLYTSFSARLGVRANLRMQRIIDSDVYKKIFPATYLTPKKYATNTARHLRNSSILEFVKQEGSFRNTTVLGSITGLELSLGIVDDPIKGREQANSETIREKTWEWFTDDFFTRFSDGAGLLFILTRWHVDDPVGRLILQDPRIKLLSYPAIAESGISRALGDNRADGEALFPEHKSLEFLMQRKAIMSSGSWSSLYQQNPVVMGGDIIKGKWFKRYTLLPKIIYRKIYADTAQKTAEHNDYSVFECWGYGEDGGAYLIDMIRGKWEAPDLKRQAIDFWQKHRAIQGVGALRQFMVEDKSSGTGLIQDIKRGTPPIPITGIERNKDKLTRVMDVLSYMEAGYVHLPEHAPFVSDFIAECEAFTADGNHAHDDQIDPMCDALSDMLATKAKGILQLL